MKIVIRIILLAAGSLLASACVSEPRFEQSYNISGANYLPGVSGRSIFSGDNF